MFGLRVKVTEVRWKGALIGVTPGVTRDGGKLSEWPELLC